MSCPLTSKPVLRQFRKAEPFKVRIKPVTIKDIFEIAQLISLFFSQLNSLFSRTV